jgi:hypothetical protein
MKRERVKTNDVRNELMTMKSSFDVEENFS